jgi:phenylpyruvate tautomerase PptA (4-oxalocrotonate tautomerase family)
MENQNQINSVKELIEHVGRDAFTKDLGHTPQVVSRAIIEDVMPAHWYVGVRDLCAGRGFTVPESLFKWGRKSPLPTQNAKSETVFEASGNDSATGSAA